MNPARALELFLLKLLAYGGVLGYLLSVFRPPIAPQLVLDRPYASSIAVSFVALFVDKFIIYPRFRDPLRGIPTITGVSLLLYSRLEGGCTSDLVHL